MSDNTMYSFGIRKEYVTSDGNRFRTRIDAMNYCRRQRRESVMNRRYHELQRLNNEQDQILKEKLERVFNDNGIINSIVQNKAVLKQILRKIKYFRV